MSQKVSQMCYRMVMAPDSEPGGPSLRPLRLPLRGQPQAEGGTEEERPTSQMTRKVKAFPERETEAWHLPWCTEMPLTDITWWRVAPFKRDRGVNCKNVISRCSDNRDMVLRRPIELSRATRVDQTSAAGPSVWRVQGPRYMFLFKTSSFTLAGFLPRILRRNSFPFPNALLGEHDEHQYE